MTGEHFRGVVWNHTKPQQGERPVYRYAIIGLLVTDQPLPALSKNEIVLNGFAAGMSDTLQSIQQAEPAFRIGDANSVLCHLNELVIQNE